MKNIQNIQKLIVIYSMTGLFILHECSARSGFLFYLILVPFIFFDFAYASLTLPVENRSYALCLKDASVEISADTANHFDYLTNAYHFASHRPFTLSDIDLKTWQILNEPFSQVDYKQYFKKLNLNDLYTIKLYYDYLQMNTEVITNALNYTILKKVLPKGTLGLFKRSIASKIFYQYYDNFYTELKDQFENFITYCTLLWQKVDLQNVRYSITIDVRCVLQDRYCKTNATVDVVLPDMPTNDKRYKYMFKDIKDIFGFCTQQNGAIPKTTILSRYLARKIFLNNNEIDLSFVMQSKKLGKCDNWLRFDYLLREENAPLGVSFNELQLVQKVLYCYTKNVTFYDVRYYCNNISVIQCKALDDQAFKYFDEIYFNPIFWKRIEYDAIFSPIDTIIVDQKSNEKLLSIKRQYYKHKIQLVKREMEWARNIARWLVGYHFLFVVLNGLTIGLCLVPTVMNQMNHEITIFNSEVAIRAKYLADCLLRSHKAPIVALVLPLIIHNSYWMLFPFQYWDDYFYFVLIVHCVYYFYLLYQKGMNDWMSYDIFYLGGFFAILSFDLGFQSRKINFKKLLGNLWNTKCPQVIVEQE